MPVYRLSYPCDLFLSIEAGDLETAKKNMRQVLEPTSDGIIVVFETPKGFHDPEERLYPRVDADGIDPNLISVEDVEGQDEEDDDTQDQLPVPEAAGGGEAGAGG